ncbi:hypothetical protein [Evansella clarkii]|nr:hypothetical protein [Evansella clarkii]
MYSNKTIGISQEECRIATRECDFATRECDFATGMGYRNKNL